MTFTLWCAAGALTIISAALYRRQMAILSAANPAVRLPWIGRPVNNPGSAKTLGVFALVPSIAAMQCVYHALGARHLYDILWSLPLLLSVLVAIAVPMAQHNRAVFDVPPNVGRS